MKLGMNIVPPCYSVLISFAP